ncbi:MAG TPA: DUF4065 domain-containing protein [Gallicola sp.]|nr:DUF4065 domain-containing protein [Gallicola sp.]
MEANFLLINKENRYKDLLNSIQFCDLCDKLCCTNKNISVLYGNINTKVLFIGDFPENNNNPDNFKTLLSNIGWNVDDIFITYALLCNPINNETVLNRISHFEIQNCSIYLETVINLIKPEVLVTLGALALDALNFIEQHDATLNKDIGKKISWNDRILIPLCSPGSSSLLHRSIPKQRADFISLAKFVDPKKGIKPKKKINKIIQKNDFVENNLSQTIYVILNSLREVTYFKLTKLLYLIDLAAIDKLGETITGSIYLRQQNGPWSPDISEAIKGMSGYEIQYYQKKLPMVYIGKSPRIEISLENKYLQIIKEIIDTYGNMTNSAIKIAVYKSAPMRYVLKQEKLRRDMRKIPLIYNNKTIVELDNNLKQSWVTQK